MPFKSKAQQRFMFAAEDRGEIPKGTAKDWAEHTPNIKKLPERKKESTMKKTSNQIADAVSCKLAKTLSPKCDTPGQKIRSQGKGRGLAIGQGRGPIGRRAEVEKEKTASEIADKVLVKLALDFKAQAKRALPWAGGAAIGAGLGAGGMALKNYLAQRRMAPSEAEFSPMEYSNAEVPPEYDPNAIMQSLGYPEEDISQLQNEWNSMPEEY